MYSMTGFGKGEYRSEGLYLSVEIKSVNGKALDISVKAPRIFVAYEDVVRTMVSEGLRRGHVDVFINYTDKREKEKQLVVDMGLVAGYVSAAAKLKAAYPELTDDLTLTSLLKMPDVLKKEEVSEEDEELLLALKEALSQAIGAILAMRKREGLKLKADILKRLDVLKTFVDYVSERAPEVVTKYRDELKARVGEYLGQVNYDEGRLLTEVAIFTDKCNIDEELTRLNSHIIEARNLLERDYTGKSLDFLMQEFMREANTICSKANDIIVTKKALEIKNEIEKVKEQVQNLE